MLFRPLLPPISSSAAVQRGENPGNMGLIFYRRHWESMISRVLNVLKYIIMGGGGELLLWCEGAVTFIFPWFITMSTCQNCHICTNMTGQEQLVPHIISCQSIPWHVALSHLVYWTENIYNRLVRCSPKAKIFQAFFGQQSLELQWKSAGWILPSLPSL